MRPSRTPAEIEIRIGAGAYVCGEETALIHSIEGERGVPRPRPPYPAASGLWEQPTLINNVETFANIPSIIKKGGKWFASIGTETRLRMASRPRRISVIHCGPARRWISA